MKYSIQAEPSTTVRNKTGSWRVLQPIFDSEKCTACGTCERVCPEGIISPSGTTNSTGKIYRQTDYNFCKGCGICASECPAKAIIMKLETN
jgi:pyruvate ferredoxin oxidoreductase delta subunit